MKRHAPKIPAPFLGRPIRSSRINRFGGCARVPGDKSISHRALMLGAFCVGETMIAGLLESEDVMATATAMRALGAQVERGGDGLWRVHGVGTGGLKTPAQDIDLGNSGTSARLIMGMLASQGITATLRGDPSLSRRPMGRVMRPLSMMGARFDAAPGDHLPLTVHGTDQALCLEYAPDIPSAQVKSAILLAGLNARGRTTVIESRATRDHTENMLRHFGAELQQKTLPDGTRIVSVTGEQELQPCAVDVPGDPSSAAFAAVAAAILPGAEVTLPGVLVNPLRAGLYDTLREMGAAVEFACPQTIAGEEVADIIVRSNGALNPVDVPPERAPSMIDEFPVLAVAAACAKGESRLRGLSELRVKESDRLSMIAQGLAACGASVRMEGDDLIIQGTGRPPAGGAHIATGFDHRIAMSFLTLGLVTDAPVTIDEGASISTSFPGFTVLMNDLGAQMEGA